MAVKERIESKKRKHFPRGGNVPKEKTVSLLERQRFGGQGKGGDTRGRLDSSFSGAEGVAYREEGKKVDIFKKGWDFRYRKGGFLSIGERRLEWRRSLRKGGEGETDFPPFNCTPKGVLHYRRVGMKGQSD